jgi:inhibitor of cysteine peptidase
MLSACQSIIPTESPTSEPTGETKYVYGEHGTVESLEVLIMESFPLQAQAVVSGYLPDGCTELVDVTVEQEGESFILTVNTRKLTGDVACTEALVPFEESVALDIAGLEAGTYTVVAQDLSETFTLDVDNVLESEEPDMKFSYGSDARVEEMFVNLMESFPVQVSVRLVGYTPDGCTKIEEIKSSREGNVFTVEIITRRPTGDIACTMAIVPFDETISLDVEGLPAGKYIVEYKELKETFTLDVDNEIPTD